MEVKAMGTQYVDKVERLEELVYFAGNDWDYSRLMRRAAEVVDSQYERLGYTPAQANTLAGELLRVGQQFEESAKARVRSALRDLEGGT